MEHFPKDKAIFNQVQGWAEWDTVGLSEEHKVMVQLAVSFVKNFC